MIAPPPQPCFEDRIFRRSARMNWNSQPKETPAAAANSDELSFWVGIPVGFLISFGFADYIYSYPQHPQFHALKLYNAILATLLGTAGAAIVALFTSESHAPARRKWVLITAIFLMGCLFILVLYRRELFVSDRQLALSLLDHAEDDVLIINRVMNRRERSHPELEPLLREFKTKREQDAMQIEAALASYR